MTFSTYDSLIKRVTEFRLEHPNLTETEQDTLVRQTFKIDRAALREIDGMTDLIQVELLRIL